MDITNAVIDETPSPIEVEKLESHKRAERFEREAVTLEAEANRIGARAAEQRLLAAAEVAKITQLERHVSHPGRDLL